MGIKEKLKKYDIKLLLTVSFVFILFVGIVSYKISSSYALFTDELNGSKTIALHYEPLNSVTVLYADGTLIINEKPSNRAANIQTHGTVSHEYPGMKSEGTNVEKYIFADETDQPWNSDAASIKKVEMGQKIYPTSTAFWFKDLTHMTQGNFTNLKTSRLTTVQSMFQNAGRDSSITSFTLTGLDSWDTSKITNMNSLFNGTGYYATILSIGDISDWNTSKVTNMKSLFQGFGYTNAQAIDLNLTNWDTSKVTNMNSMFRGTGYNASTTWSIGDLTHWDVSKVTDMGYMFGNACRNVSVCDIGNLSSWNTSQVTDMNNMFRVFASEATTLDIGSLSNWNTSKVTDMSGMFRQTGNYSTTWSVGDLSGWDTSQVTDMNYMFMNSCASSSVCNIGNLSDWDTLKVKDMSYMFRGYGVAITTTFDISFVANWNVSNVTNMSGMFSNAGYSASSWSIGNLSGWDTSKVTDMSVMFDCAAFSATTVTNMGTLKIYATNTYRMFRNCRRINAIMNIYSNPQSGNPGYNETFAGAANMSGALITVNYKSTTTNIDAIIATKSSTSNVVKGSVIS